MHTLGQFFANVFVQAHFMTDMGYIGVSRLDDVNDCKSLWQREMREMCAFTKSVDNQYLAATQFIQLFIVNVVCICDIGNWTNAIAQNGQIFVHSPYRDDGFVVCLKRVYPVKNVKVGLWQPGIRVRLKNIVIVALQRIECNRVAIDLHLAVLHIVESTNII